MRELGFGRSDEGHIRARASSYVNAMLVIDKLEVLHDVFYLLEDLANGVFRFDTDTERDGSLGLLSFKIPIKQGEKAAPNPPSLFSVQPWQQGE
ncbi:hypothetical protein D8674_009368 [Pyrus ussuriensis x Pyrus communis]|uniref:Uncharacterized protein n=1 Tax=Pyrus ussuriensis x Pyrus communis TaxID=2448454 RepID=A0A5N5F819_9ROSA|nr:hypothetical protein D8674_009368 [Pyrus ussuriensis x Pyrus communis]